MNYGLSCQWDAKERCAWGSWPPQSATQKGGPPQGNDLELGIIEVELLPVSWGTVEIRECEEYPGTTETRANNTEPTARLGIHFRGPQIAYCNIALGPWLESLFPHSSTTVCPWTYFFYVAYHLQLQKQEVHLRTHFTDGACANRVLTQREFRISVWRTPPPSLLSLRLMQEIRFWPTLNKY